MTVSSSTEIGIDHRPVPFRVSGSVATGTILQPLNAPMLAIGVVSIASQFNSSPAVSWLIPALYISSAVAAPLAGRLGALYGSRRVYLLGLGLVATASVVGTFAPTIGWLIAAYVILGTGLAAHFPNAMTMIRSYADRLRRQARTGIMIIAVCGQSTAALGPSIGGLMIGTFGWQSIMWINLPVVAFSALAVTRFVDLSSPDRGTAPARSGSRSLDLLGGVLLLGLLTSTMLLLLSLGQHPRWWLLALWAVLLASFIERERRAREPVIDVRALARNRALTTTLARTTMCYIAFYCVLFGLPQWLQYAHGMTAAQTGLTMLPLAAVSLVSSILASRTIQRFGARSTLAIGMSAIIASGLLLALVERSSAPVVVLLIVAGVLGIPTGFNNIGNQNLINSVTSVDDVGMAIGMYRTVQFVGANLAAVVLQKTAGHVINDNELHNTGWVIVVLGVTLLFGVLNSRHLPSKSMPHKACRR